MKNTKLTAAAALVLALAAPGARVYAQNEPCKADAEKLCGDRKGPDRMACMKSHEAELSEACKAKLGEMKGKMGENRPCSADAAKFCGDSKNMMERMTCLKGHDAGLSAGCKAKMVEMKGKTGEMKAGMPGNGPCAADAEKFCAGVKPGEGRILDCLKQHEVELSTGCRAMGNQAVDAMARFRETCKADLAKLCKDVKPGEGRLLKCAREHEKELSETCKAGVAAELRRERGGKKEEKPR